MFVITYCKTITAVHNRNHYVNVPAVNRSTTQSKRNLGKQRGKTVAAIILNIIVVLSMKPRNIE